MFTYKASFFRRLRLVALAVCLQGAQAALASHVLDPCDFVAEQLGGAGCTQACDQCAPQAGASDALVPAGGEAALPEASHALAMLERDAPVLPPRFFFHGRAPPSLN